MTSPPDRSVKDTPIRRQYERLKAEHPDCLLLFQLGDFFECFQDDARSLARVCGVTLTSRELGKGDRVPLAGIPLTRLDHYLARLIEAGHHVAVAEQISPPGSGLVERVVTRVVTPGTLAEPGLLREKENTYLVSVLRGRHGIGLAYADVSTGEFAVTQFDGEEAEARLAQELERIRPAEVLAAEGQEPGPLPSGHLTVCQPWRFQETSARERLCAHLGVLSLEGYGCGRLPLAVGAAGAILSYLEETNRRLLPNLTDLHAYSTGGSMPLDEFTRRNLELLRNARSGKAEGSLLWLLDATLTPMGGRLLRRWLVRPLLDRAEIERRLDAVGGLHGADGLRGRVRTLLGRVGDLERRVGRIAQGLASPRELHDLAASLRTVGSLRDLAAEPAPGGTQRAADDAGAGALAHLDACPEAVAIVERGVAPPHSGRSVRPGYSPDLDALIASVGASKQQLARVEAQERQRTGIKSLKVGYTKVFGYFIEVTKPNLALVPADYQRRQTLANAERFVTAELKECEARILHAEERIEALEREVYESLLRELAGFGARLRRLARVLAHLDVFAALAEVARARGYCRPALDDGLGLDISGGRHPVVEARLDAGEFIQNDARLDAADCQVMILTGPNMAGKSTYLRQVALIVLLAQVGSFVPARTARLGLVDRIFTRVGAQDDIAAGASTFMVEMMEAANILRHATPRSLIVLDEVGRGTSTFDGLSIARALVEEIHERVGARTLFATHFHELAELAAELPRVRAYRVAVAEEGRDVVFLRTVLPGGASRSYGIHVARLAGLPPEVTERAERILRRLEDRAPHEAAEGLAPVAGPQQLPLDGFAARRAAPADLLRPLLELDLATLTPLEALNRLWEVQRRAGRT